VCVWGGGGVTSGGFLRKAGWGVVIYCSLSGGPVLVVDFQKNSSGGLSGWARGGGGETGGAVKSVWGLSC
jgi:hypothetical protein